MKLRRTTRHRRVASVYLVAAVTCLASCANGQTAPPPNAGSGIPGKASGGKPGRAGQPEPDSGTPSSTPGSTTPGTPPASTQQSFSKSVTVTTVDPITINDDPIAANIEALMELSLNGKSVKVAVRRLEGGKSKIYVAVVAGTLHSKEASDRIMAKLQAIKAGSGLDDLVIVNNIDNDLTPGAVEVTYLWQVGFLQGDTDFDGKVTLANLADGLNAVFPNPESGGVPFVTVKDTNLWLHGPQSSVQKIRAILAMLDAPTPEIRLDVWAIQYAGSQSDVGRRMLDLTHEIAQAQHAAEMAKQALGYAVQKNAESITADDSFQALRSVGFDVDPKSSLSLLESLICIGISDHRSSILKDAQAALKQLLPADAPWLTKGLQRETDFFPNLAVLLAQPGGSTPGNTAASDQLSVLRFTQSMKRYISFIDALGLYGASIGDSPDDLLKQYPAAPEGLARESLTFNRQLEHLVDALAADMQQMFFTPLLERAQLWNYGGHGGIGLAGKTEIVVNSRLHADVTAQMELYGERQVPRPFGQGSPDSGTTATTAPAVTTAATSPTAAATTATTASTTAPTTTPSPTVPSFHFGDLLGGLNPADRFLALAALLPTSDVTYYKVAPGIAIHVTPAMTPDGTTANVKLDATFGEETTTQKDPNLIAQSFRPPDSVKQHQVQTVANVGGFNLFEVSSFNMDTLYPRPPFITPVLGNLPLIGNMFRFERGTNRTYHQSVILVNATLIPRSLGLVGFYGSNFAGRTILSNATSRASGKLNYQDFIKDDAR